MASVGLQLIFLDIDGVLNDHCPHANGYCGFKPECVDALNWLLARWPKAQIVVSSAWRYLVHSGSMTLNGLEAVLLIGGVNCYKRVHGITDTDSLRPHDADTSDLDREERPQQIERYAARFGCERFVVLDDLEIPHEHLVRTDGKRGLTLQLAQGQACVWLAPLPEPSLEEMAAVEREGADGRERLPAVRQVQERAHRGRADRLPALVHRHRRQQREAGGVRDRGSRVHPAEEDG